MASRNVSGRLSVNLVFTVAFADLKPYLSLPPHRATDKKETQIGHHFVLWRRARSIFLQFSGNPDVWIRRDDGTAVSCGGNKARNLAWQIDKDVPARSETVVFLRAGDTAGSCGYHTFLEGEI